MEVRHLNLIDEISCVCPKQADLKTISSEEVLSRINEYNTKSSILEQEDQSSTSSYDSDRYDEDAHLQ